MGTIKHAAYILLSRATSAGLTVSSIVEQATSEGLYCWGSCKTPNNSVTAALSQDSNFSRVAPSTYTLRSYIRPVGERLRDASALRASGGGAHKMRSAGAEGRTDPYARTRTSAEAGPAPSRRPSSLRLDASCVSPRARAAPQSQQSQPVAAAPLHSATAAAALCVQPPPEEACTRVALSAAAGLKPEVAPSPDTPMDGVCDALPPSYSPKLQNAASCLFLFPVAHQHVPMQPISSPEAPTEAEARASAWRHEVGGGAKRGLAAALSAGPPSPQPVRAQLPSWVLRAWKEEREGAAPRPAEAQEEEEDDQD